MEGPHQPMADTHQQSAEPANGGQAATVNQDSLAPGSSDAKFVSRRNKSKISCCVPLCDKPGYVTDGDHEVTFHTLPKDESLLKQWIVKMRRDIGPLFKVTKHTKICSRHFKASDFRVTQKGRRFLQPHAIPTENFAWSKPAPKSVYRRCVGSVQPETVPTAPCLPTAEDIPQDTTVESAAAAQSSDTDSKLLRRIAELELLLAKEKASAELYKKERDHVRSVCQSLKEEQNNLKAHCLFRIENFLKSDSDINFYTGFSSAHALEQCFRLLNPSNNIIYKDYKGKRKVVKECKLSYLNQFFLTLVRLRLGLLEKDLACRFQISVTSVHRYFISWVNFMYLKLGSINIWPTKEAIVQTMPESMKEKFPQLEWIIDAFEIQTQRPASLMLQSQSYSSYKSRNTLKGLVACLPSGQIGFVSQLYTGSISDRELVIRSGFLDMPHNKGAVWLVDKGFQIADLAEPLGVVVNMPAFVGCKNQMNESEVFKTQTIASERIHIERAINKVKKFHFFDRAIPISILGTINQAWCVCTLLTLFQSPIISA